MHEPPPWNESGWFEEVQGWIHTALLQQGIMVTQPIEQIHARPWSTILRIPTSTTPLFFKACTAYEVALTVWLSQHEPQYVPRLLAIEQTHAWMIMQDGGQRLREILLAQPDWQHWDALLPDFAKLQQTAAHHLDQLLAAGIPDRRLARFPTLYEELLADAALFRVDLPDGISAIEYQRLQDLLPVVAEKCHLLAAHSIPESVHHGDLHDGNIFYSAPHYAFYDWGDCSISHPFFSLRTAYVSAEIRFDLPENAPALQRLRDAYLKAWRDYATEAQLHTAFGLAEELWAVSSMFIWYTMLNRMTTVERADYTHVFPSLTREFLGLIKP